MMSVHALQKGESKKTFPVVGIEPGSLAFKSLSKTTIIAFGSLSVSFGFVAQVLALDDGSVKVDKGL